MTALLCQHPEESREPLPYDGVSPADPDDWRCGECGGLGLRLDRRTYERREAAAREQERIDAEFEKFAERQRPVFMTEPIRTREGDVYVPVALPPTDFRNETVTAILDQIFKASGVSPVLMTGVDQTSVFDTMDRAVSAAREKVIEGGFDPSRPDADLLDTILTMGPAARYAFRRVDRIEFAHDLFHRAMSLTTDYGASPFGYNSARALTLMGLPLDRKDLPSFAFRVVGS